MTVTFTRVAFIRTGELAHYTAGDQWIGFQVFPTRLENTQTQENLLIGSPDAFFAVRAIAITSDDPAHSTQYCLDILRSMALNPNSGAQLHLFLNVTHVTATNFVVHKFDSCEVQIPDRPIPNKHRSRDREGKHRDD
ncbi:MAG: hypothetical protein ABW318_20520 [Vicinamibacterales bacterium]